MTMLGVRILLLAQRACVDIPKRLGRMPANSRGSETASHGPHKALFAVRFRAPRRKRPLGGCLMALLGRRPGFSPGTIPAEGRRHPSTSGPLVVCPPVTRTRICLAVAVLALGLACSMPDTDEDGNPSVGAPAGAATSATTAPVPSGPVTSIAEGTWTVGVDIVAGTYRVVGAGKDCYWSITKTGSNGSDIVDNAIGGGNLSVTLKAGQDFTTKRCGTWQKTA